MVTDERRAEREGEYAAIAGICFLLLFALLVVPAWVAFSDWLARA